MCIVQAFPATNNQTAVLGKNWNDVAPADRGARKIANLEYIRQMLIELRMIAKNEGTLAYLLEISALEAGECIKTHLHGSELTR